MSLSLRRRRAPQPRPRPRRPPVPAPPAAAPGLRAALRPPSRGPVRAAAERVVAAIERVHAVPLVLPAVSVTGTANTVRVGGYRYVDAAGPGGPAALRACGITVARGAAGLPFNLAHEVGHLLDHVAIGSPDAFASTGRDPLLDDLVGAIRGTAAHAGLRAVRSPARRRYLGDRRELVARAYAQYVALRSGDPELTALLATARRPAPDGTPGGQWDDDDFGPVAAALDRLIDRLGWAPATGGRP